MVSQSGIRNPLCRKCNSCILLLQLLLLYHQNGENWYIFSQNNRKNIQKSGQVYSAAFLECFVSSRPETRAVKGATVTSPRLPTTVSRISDATYL